MNKTGLIEHIQDTQKQLSRLLPNLRLEEKEAQQQALATQMLEEGFWGDVPRAQAISQQQAQLAESVAFWRGLVNRVAELAQLVQENTDEGSETMAYLAAQVQGIQKEFLSKRFEALLSGRHDSYGAVVSIHAGAGGTDAQDWAEILFRMYTRYMDKKGLKVEIIEMNRGGEAGIKSTLLQVSGMYAYGYLKGEAGVHRLVRLSPFNPAHTRETSFALVEVLPALPETEATLNMSEVKIEANTASGHGGQSVNTTYSAIRVTHIPTGIKVSIQNERSQHQNKELALKILAARLAAVEEERRLAERKELRGEFKSAEWGNQIRSYVLHPYQMVKDHRTNVETSDTEAVLDGELDQFIEGYLEQGAKSG
ncbi:MAG: peptide chain release factor 2 [Candidatus Doudnabacteria bacterium]|nr:peptide chain release factor 2 [Candidatus Doudnabacteria bacterium]